MVAHTPGWIMRLIARIGLALALLLAGWSARGGELQLLTEEYPPLSFTRGACYRTSSPRKLPFTPSTAGWFLNWRHAVICKT